MRSSKAELGGLFYLRPTKTARRQVGPCGGGCTTVILFGLNKTFFSCCRRRLLLLSPLFGFEAMLHTIGTCFFIFSNSIVLYVFFRQLPTQKAGLKVQSVHTSNISFPPQVYLMPQVQHTIQVKTQKVVILNSSF